MNALLGSLPDTPSALSKNAAAELVKANASQLVSALLKNGFDQQSAKTLIEYFTATLLSPDKSADGTAAREPLASLTRHFATLPTLQTRTEITHFKKGIDTLLKQMLHTLVPKATDTAANAPLKTYAQNQLFRHSELSAALSGTIQDTEKNIPQRERREQHLFGLAENRETDTRKDSGGNRNKKKGSSAEMIQLLLAMKHSFKTVLQALLDFQKEHDRDEALRLVPDLSERIRFLKERLRECDAVLRNLY